MAEETGCESALASKFVDEVGPPPLGLESEAIRHGWDGLTRAEQNTLHGMRMRGRSW